MVSLGSVHEMEGAGTLPPASRAILISNLGIIEIRPENGSDHAGAGLGSIAKAQDGPDVCCSQMRHMYKTSFIEGVKPAGSGLQSADSGEPFFGRKQKQAVPERVSKVRYVHGRGAGNLAQCVGGRVRLLSIPHP